MNRAYINLYAPIIKVFKLDKAATTVDEVYGEVSGSRIYLPPFEMKAFHLDNTWTQTLGEGTMPYLETQENISFIVNFEDMVQKIRDLRNAHTSEINIDYSGTGTPSASKIGTTFVLKENGSAIITADLTNGTYNTVQKLGTIINNQSNFSVTLVGENALSTDIISFNEVSFANSVLQVYVADPTYQNCTDIIESGDVILTHNWHLYEVLKNVPTGDFGWNYVTYKLDCNIRSLDEAVLPAEYTEQIKRHEYGIRERIEIE